MYRRTAIVPVVLLAGCLAACSSGKATPAPAAGNPAAAGSAAATTAPAAEGSTGCGKLTAATVGRALGMTLEAPQETDNGSVTLCQYNQPGQVTGATVRFETGISSSQFAQIKESFLGNGSTPKDEPGVGEAAFSQTLSDFNTVVALQDGLDLLVTSRASIEQEKALLRQIFASQ